MSESDLQPTQMSGTKPDEPKPVICPRGHEMKLIVEHREYDWTHPPLPDMWYAHYYCEGNKFSFPDPRFSPHAHCCYGGERLPRRMDWIVGRATEGSSGRHSSTLRATPAVIPGKVGEGIANPFPKGALLAPRASGKPFGVSADTRPCSQHLQVRNLVPSGTR